MSLTVSTPVTTAGRRDPSRAITTTDFASINRCAGTIRWPSSITARAAPVRVEEPTRTSTGNSALLARVLTSVDQSSVLTYFGCTAITGASATCSRTRTGGLPGVENASQSALVNSAPPNADIAASPKEWRALHDGERVGDTTSLGCRQRRSSSAGGGRKTGSSSSLLRTDVRLLTPWSSAAAGGDVGRAQRGRIAPAPGDTGVGWRSPPVTAVPWCRAGANGRHMA